MTTDQIRSPFAHPSMKYFSTRGGSERLSFEEVNPHNIMLGLFIIPHRPSSLGLLQTVVSTSPNASLPYHQIGDPNGVPILSCSSVSPSCPYTSPLRKSRLWNWHSLRKDRMLIFDIRPWRRWGGWTRRRSFSSCSMVRLTLSRMWRYNC